MMRSRITILTMLSAGLVLIGSSLAKSDPGEAQKIAERIDQAIERQLDEADLEPVRLTDDVEFLRRAYLDLAGRVPSAEEARAFLDKNDSNKRQQLIDKLLASEDFGKQLGRVWRDWIAPAELPSEGNGGNQPIQATRNLGKWFAEQFNRNKGWDEIVKSIIEVEGNLDEHPQGLFYSLTGTDTGIPEPAGATRAVSSLFLGLDLQCAQCHDDPYREWSQTDFWATAAFFKNMEGRFKGRYFDSIAESFDKKLGKGGKKTTLNDKSPNGSISIPRDSFKNAGLVVEGRYVLGGEIEANEKQPLRPRFADWLTSADNPYFAKAFVNRIWAHYFSRGLVVPIDDLRPDNTPSHPEVLNLLTEEFTQSGFDVKHLVRCILNTKAWQRTSSAETKSERKLFSLYGRREMKLQSADQLYDSLKLALVDPKLDLRTYDSKKVNKFGESSPVGDAYTEFRRLFETDELNATNFTHGIPQFLALLNHPNVSDGGRMVEQLIKDETEPSEAVETMYLSTLSRRPTSAEKKEALAFIEESPDRETAYAGVLWMLLNRTEFLLVR